MNHSPWLSPRAREAVNMLKESDPGLYALCLRELADRALANRRVDAGYPLTWDGRDYDAPEGGDERRAA